jgi:hypothetical protein
MMQAMSTVHCDVVYKNDSIHLGNWLLKSLLNVHVCKDKITFFVLMNLSVSVHMCYL